MVFNEELYAGKFLTITKDPKTGWEKVSRTSTEAKKEDAVVIVGRNILSNKYVCILEKRYPIMDHSGNSIALAFPAGLTDGDTPLEAAERELEEETGYKIVNVNSITPILYNSAGMTDESCRMVYCDVEPNGKQKLQGLEEIEVIEMNVDDFVEFGNSEASENVEYCAKVYQHFQTIINIRKGEK